MEESSNETVIEEYEVKSVDAETFITCRVDCPYCARSIDLWHDTKLREWLGGEIEKENIEFPVTYNDCKKEFIVQNVCY